MGDRPDEAGRARSTAVRVRARRSDAEVMGRDPGIEVRRVCMPSTMRRISLRARLKDRAITMTTTIFEAVSRCQSSGSAAIGAGLVRHRPNGSQDGPTHRTPPPVDTVARHGRFPPTTGLPPPRITRHRRARRRRRTWPQRFVLTGSSLMAGACVVAAFGVWYANDRLQNLERVVITHASAVTVAGSGPTDTAAPPSPSTYIPGNAQNFLLIGCEVGKESCTAANSPLAGGLGNVTSELSDTIILVRVGRATAQAAILSFPRDLWVTIVGTGRKGKINSAYQPDNPSRLVQTIEESFGVYVDHTVQVSCPHSSRSSTRSAG